MLKKLWSKWKPFAQKIGDFQARVILSVFYFIFVSPIGIIFKFADDSLRLKKPKTNSYWINRGRTKPSLEDERRQF
jgi:hypothetical protein